MATVYIDSGSQKFIMDATESVTISLSGSPTEYAVESGRKPSDHYQQNQDTISIRGFVSNVRFERAGGNTLNVKEWISGIHELKNSGAFFTVSATDSLSVYKNCQFSSLTLTFDVDSGKHGVNISADIVQVEVAQQISSGAAPEVFAQYQNILESKSTSKGGTVEPTATQTAKVQQTLSRGDSVVNDWVADNITDVAL